MSVKHVLIVNLHSSENVGDAALTDIAIRQLHTAFPEASITLALSDPSSHRGPEAIVPSFYTWARQTKSDRRSHWRFPSFPFWLLMAWMWLTLSKILKRHVILLPSEKHTLIEAYLDADVVVSCPGHILYSSGRFGLSFLLAITSLYAAVWADKPLYVMPQSFGPLWRGWERQLARWALGHARVVFAREPQSHNTLLALKLRSNLIRLVPDLAFACVRSSNDQGGQWLAQYGIQLGAGSPLIGVTLINWSAQNFRFVHQVEYEEAFTILMRMWIRDYSARFIIFPQVTGPTIIEDDRVPARRVLSRLGGAAQHVTLIDEPALPETLIDAIRFMDIFVGTRMHSNIFALSQQVPVLAISYHHKTQAIMQMLNLGRWVIPIEDLRGDVLCRRVQELWITREIVRAHLKATMPIIAEHASQLGCMIAADYVLREAQ